MTIGRGTPIGRSSFAEHGVKLKGFETRHIKMNSLPLLLQAACEGQGIALGYGLLTDDLLATRDLGPPARGFRSALPAAITSCFRDRKSSDQVIAFRDWMLEHFDRAEAGGVAAATGDGVGRSRQSTARCLRYPGT